MATEQGSSPSSGSFSWVASASVGGDGVPISLSSSWIDDVTAAENDAQENPITYIGPSGEIYDALYRPVMTTPTASAPSPSTSMSRTGLPPKKQPTPPPQQQAYVKSVKEFPEPDANEYESYWDFEHALLTWRDDVLESLHAEEGAGEAIEQVAHYLPQSVGRQYFRPRIGAPVSSSSSSFSTGGGSGSHGTGSASIGRSPSPNPLSSSQTLGAIEDGYEPQGDSDGDGDGEGDSDDNASNEDEAGPAATSKSATTASTARTPRVTKAKDKEKKDKDPAKSKKTKSKPKAKARAATTDSALVGGSKKSSVSSTSTDAINTSKGGSGSSDSAPANRTKSKPGSGDLPTNAVDEEIASVGGSGGVGLSQAALRGIYGGAAVDLTPGTSDTQPWSSLFIPPEPNPIDYATFAGYSIAMRRWASLVHSLTSTSTTPSLSSSSSSLESSTLEDGTPHEQQQRQPPFFSQLASLIPPTTSTTTSATTAATIPASTMMSNANKDNETASSTMFGISSSKRLSTHEEGEERLRRTQDWCVAGGSRVGLSVSGLADVVNMQDRPRPPLWCKPLSVASHVLHDRPPPDMQLAEAPRQSQSLIVSQRVRNSTNTHIHTPTHHAQHHPHHDHDHGDDDDTPSAADKHGRKNDRLDRMERSKSSSALPRFHINRTAPGGGNGSTGGTGGIGHSTARGLAAAVAAQSPTSTSTNNNALPLPPLQSVGVGGGLSRILDRQVQLQMLYNRCGSVPVTSGPAFGLDSLSSPPSTGANAATSNNASASSGSASSSTFSKPSTSASTKKHGGGGGHEATTAVASTISPLTPLPPKASVALMLQDTLATPMEQLRGNSSQRVHIRQTLAAEKTYARMSRLLQRTKSPSSSVSGSLSPTSKSTTTPSPFPPPSSTSSSNNSAAAAAKVASVFGKPSFPAPNAPASSIADSVSLLARSWQSKIKTSADLVRHLVENCDWSHEWVNIVASGQLTTQWAQQAEWAHATPNINSPLLELFDQVIQLATTATATATGPSGNSTASQRRATLSSPICPSLTTIEEAPRALELVATTTSAYVVMTKPLALNPSNSASSTSPSTNTTNNTAFGASSAILSNEIFPFNLATQCAIERVGGGSLRVFIDLIYCVYYMEAVYKTLGIVGGFSGSSAATNAGGGSTSASAAANTAATNNTNSPLPSPLLQRIHKLANTVYTRLIEPDMAPSARVLLSAVCRGIGHRSSSVSSVCHFALAQLLRSPTLSAHAETWLQLCYPPHPPARSTTTATSGMSSSHGMLSESIGPEGKNILLHEVRVLSRSKYSHTQWAARRLACYVQSVFLFDVVGNSPAQLLAEVSNSGPAGPSSSSTSSSTHIHPNAHSTSTDDIVASGRRGTPSPTRGGWPRLVMESISIAEVLEDVDAAGFRNLPIQLLERFLLNLIPLIDSTTIAVSANLLHPRFFHGSLSKMSQLLRRFHGHDMVGGAIGGGIPSSSMGTKRRGSSIAAFNAVLPLQQQPQQQQQQQASNDRSNTSPLRASARDSTTNTTTEPAPVSSAQQPKNAHHYRRTSSSILRTSANGRRNITDPFGFMAAAGGAVASSSSASQGPSLIGLTVLANIAALVAHVFGQLETIRVVVKLPKKYTLPTGALSSTPSPSHKPTFPQAIDGNNAWVLPITTSIVDRLLMLASFGVALNTSGSSGGSFISHSPYSPLGNSSNTSSANAGGMSRYHHHHSRHHFGPAASSLALPASISVWYVGTARTSIVQALGYLLLSPSVLSLLDRRKLQAQQPVGAAGATSSEIASAPTPASAGGVAASFIHTSGSASQLLSNAAGSPATSVSSSTAEANVPAVARYVAHREVLSSLLYITTHGGPAVSVGLIKATCFMLRSLLLAHPRLCPMILIPTSSIAHPPAPSTAGQSNPTQQQRPTAGQESSSSAKASSVPNISTGTSATTTTTSDGKSGGASSANSIVTVAPTITSAAPGSTSSASSSATDGAVPKVGVPSTSTEDASSMLAQWLEGTLSLRSIPSACQLLATLSALIKLLPKREAKDVLQFIIKYDYMTKFNTIMRRIQHDKAASALFVEMVFFVAALLETKHVYKRLRTSALSQDVLDGMLRLASVSGDEKLIKAMHVLKSQ